MTKAKGKEYDYMIGIDPGINVGYATWFVEDKLLCYVTSESLFKIFEWIAGLNQTHSIKVRIENPNTWIGFKGQKRESFRLQGAGAVKQSYKHIIEFLEHHKIDYEPVRLQGSMKKLSAARFKELTGYTDRTNEHGRDAAMLVFNSN